MARLRLAILNARTDLQLIFYIVHIDNGSLYVKLALKFFHFISSILRAGGIQLYKWALIPAAHVLLRKRRVLKAF